MGLHSYFEHAKRVLSTPYDDTSKRVMILTFLGLIVMLVALTFFETLTDPGVNDIYQLDSVSRQKIICLQWIRTGVVLLAFVLFFAAILFCIIVVSTRVQRQMRTYSHPESKDGIGSVPTEKPSERSTKGDSCT